MVFDVLPCLKAWDSSINAMLLVRVAGELRVWARDAGVTLPGPEPDALAGESGTSSYGI